MGEIVQMRGPATTVQPTPDTSMSAMRERMRRADVEDSLRRLLKDGCRGDPRLDLRVTRDGDGLLMVVARIDGGSARQLSPAYPETRLDDFAGVVRAGLTGWTRALQARLRLRVVA
jgi:hypothetical protein